MQRAIHNHKGDVYDPFVGSGTTVIAGEQEGRRVYGISQRVEAFRSPAQWACAPFLTAYQHVSCLQW